MARKSTTSIKLEDDLRDRLNHLATSQQRSANWLMRQAIGEFVEREERRERFKHDAERAWEDYQATGLHLTGEEIEAWLERRAKGDDAELPE